MDNFWSSLRQAFGHLGTIRVMDIVDILLVAAFFYFLITLVRRTKTNKLFQGIVYILLALWLSGEMQLYTVNYILRNAVQVGLLALVVLFQPEIRRFLEKLGTGSIRRRCCDRIGRDRRDLRGGQRNAQAASHKGHL